MNLEERLDLALIDAGIMEGLFGNLFGKATTPEDKLSEVEVQIDKYLRTIQQLISQEQKLRKAYAIAAPETRKIVIQRISEIRGEIEHQKRLAALAQNQQRNLIRQIGSSYESKSGRKSLTNRL